MLSYWLHVDTAEPTTTAYDTLIVQILDSGGAVLATYANKDAASGYAQHTVDVSAYKGQTIMVKFTGTEDYTKQTSFVLDDTALTVSGRPSSALSPSVIWPMWTTCIRGRTASTSTSAWRNTNSACW